MTSKQRNCHETLTDIQYTVCLLITLLLQLIAMHYSQNTTVQFSYVLLVGRFLEL